ESLELIDSVLCAIVQFLNRGFYPANPITVAPVASGGAGPSAEWKVPRHIRRCRAERRIEGPDCVWSHRCDPVYRGGEWMRSCILRLRQRRLAGYFRAQRLAPGRL